MKYYVEKDPADFDFWGDARDRMDGATEKQNVYERLEEYASDGTERSETDVNDFVRYACDDIFYEEDSAGSLY